MPLWQKESPLSAPSLRPSLSLPFRFRPFDNDHDGRTVFNNLPPRWQPYTAPNIHHDWHSCPKISWWTSTVDMSTRETDDTAPVHPTPASLEHQATIQEIVAQQKPVEMAITPEITSSVPSDDFVCMLFHWMLIVVYCCYVLCYAVRCALNVWICKKELNCWSLV